MKMTKACEYGLQGVLYLAMHADMDVILLSEISEARAIPYSFLGKIFRLLVKANIVKSTRGVNGGFTLAREAKSISMKDVIEAVEGDISFSECSSKTQNCSRLSCCSMAQPWQESQHRALEVLANVNFHDLARKEKEQMKQ